jgi:hypothetical protein
VKGKTLLIAFLSISVVSIALVYEDRQTTYTCLHCRATLHKRTVLGFDRSRIDLPPRFNAYPKPAEDHSHHWCASGSARTRSVFTVIYACGPRHPIWEVPVRDQDAYAASVPAAQFAATLRDIDSPDEAIASAAVDRMMEATLDSFGLKHVLIDPVDRVGGAQPSGRSLDRHQP